MSLYGYYFPAGGKMITFVCNGEKQTTDCPGGLPVLDWIRDRYGLKGTKEGCREGDCGACTVVIGRNTSEGIKYSSVCSCLLPMQVLQGCHLVTVEGLSQNGLLTPFQSEFYEQAASQCGFCTPGMIMSLTGFLLGERELTFENAMESLDGNICRCTGYGAVQRAVMNVISSMSIGYEHRLEMLIEKGHVPEYFREIPELLQSVGQGEQVSGKTAVAGGTDLYVHPPDEVFSDELLLIQAPSGIGRNADTVTVGAGATIESIRESAVFRELFPTLDGFFRKISSTQIRSRATLGGNIMNGSPIADLAVLFLALGASVHTAGGKIPLKNFYLGYKKFAVAKGELLTELTFPVPKEGSILSAVKVCKREYLDIASVNSAALFKIEKGSIAFATVAAGGVFPYPLFLERTSCLLSGRDLSEETIALAETSATGEIAPISDIRGSKEYKTELLKSQIRFHLTRGATR